MPTGFSGSKETCRPNSAFIRRCYAGRSANGCSPSSPDIEAGGVMAIPATRFSVHDFAKGEEDGAGLTLYRTSRSMFDVLGTEIVAGDIDRFDDPQGTVILSQSAARSIFRLSPIPSGNP